MDIPPPPSLEAEPPPSSSLAGRLANVIAAPTEVFDDIRARDPETGNWLAPLILSILSTALFIFIGFSQPAVLQNMRDQQTAALAKKVADGKMTEKQATDAKAMMESMGGESFKYIAVVGGMFTVPMFLFLGALVTWGIGVKAAGGDYGYNRALEITGLASVVNVVGVALTLPVVILRGDMSSGLSAAALFPSVPPNGALHVLLAALNPMMFWWMFILALGMARLGNKRLGPPLAWLLGIYGVITGGSAGLAFLIAKVT